MLGAAKADDQQLIDAVVRSGADIFLSRDAAGFDLPVGERGSRLSGGQRSLLVLARALVSPSKLLFLDEPTGSMDTQTELYFIEHLKTALAPDQTLVVATHRHNMLSILDRLIVIDGGKIIADGPRDEVLEAFRPRAAAPSKASRNDRARPSLRRRRLGALRWLGGAARSCWRGRARRQPDRAAARPMRRRVTSRSPPAKARALIDATSGDAGQRDRRRSATRPS